jgi:hypothetical protein
MGMYLEKEKVVSRCQKSQSAEPVDEESQASSRHQSYTISCADMVTVEEVEVQSRADEEWSSTNTEATKGVDVESHVGVER